MILLPQQPLSLLFPVLHWVVDMDGVDRGGFGVFEEPAVRPPPKKRYGWVVVTNSAHGWVAGAVTARLDASTTAHCDLTCPGWVTMMLTSDGAIVVSDGHVCHTLDPKWPQSSFGSKDMGLV